MNARKIIAYACGPILLCSSFGAVTFHVMLSVLQIPDVGSLGGFYLWTGVCCGILCLALLAIELYLDWCRRKGRPTSLSDENLAMGYIYVSLFIPGLLVAFSAVFAGGGLAVLWQSQDAMANVLRKQKAEISELRAAIAAKPAAPASARPSRSRP